eukprot:59804_1
MAAQKKFRNVEIINQGNKECLIRCKSQSSQITALKISESWAQSQSQSSSKGQSSGVSVGCGFGGTSANISHDESKDQSSGFGSGFGGFRTKHDKSKDQSSGFGGFNANISHDESKNQSQASSSSSSGSGALSWNKIYSDFIQAGYVKIRPGNSKRFAVSTEECYISVATFDAKLQQLKDVGINNWQTIGSKFIFDKHDDLQEVVQQVLNIHNYVGKWVCMKNNFYSGGVIRIDNDKKWYKKNEFYGYVIIIGKYFSLTRNLKKANNHLIIGGDNGKGFLNVRRESDNYEWTLRKI